MDRPMGYIKWSRDRWRHVTLKGKIRHSSAIVVVDSVRDLGVITIDSQLCSLPMEYGRAIVALCRGGYYQLRQSIRPIIRSLSTTAAETLVYAFVWSRLDYCNALLCDRRWAVP